MLVQNVYFCRAFIVIYVWLNLRKNYGTKNYNSTQSG